MSDIDFQEKLQEIVNRIENEVLSTLSDGGEDWFAAQKVNDVLNIINEYIRLAKELNEKASNPAENVIAIREDWEKS